MSRTILLSELMLERAAEWDDPDTGHWFRRRDEVPGPAGQIPFRRLALEHG